MKLLIKKLDKQAKIPSYAHPNDAGMDLYSIDECVINPNEIKLIRTGISIQLPEGTEAQIRPRSGLALKDGITVLNSPGTIDEGYRGEIGIILINHSKKPFNIEVGSKIAQMVIKPVIRVEIELVPQINSTDRGSDGFGSTGS